VFFVLQNIYLPSSNIQQRNDTPKKHTKTFSKNFVENPLLETFEVGKLHLSSGIWWQVIL
jgi:hypothetical protein